MKAILLFFLFFLCVTETLREVNGVNFEGKTLSRSSHHSHSHSESRVSACGTYVTTSDENIKSMVVVGYRSSCPKEFLFVTDETFAVANSNETISFTLTTEYEVTHVYSYSSTTRSFDGEFNLTSVSGSVVFSSFTPNPSLVCTEEPEIGTEYDLENFDCTVKNVSIFVPYTTQFEGQCMLSVSKGGSCLFNDYSLKHSKSKGCLTSVFDIISYVIAATMIIFVFVAVCKMKKMKNARIQNFRSQGPQNQGFGPQAQGPYPQNAYPQNPYPQNAYPQNGYQNGYPQNTYQNSNASYFPNPESAQDFVQPYQPMMNTTYFPANSNMQYTPANSTMSNAQYFPAVQNTNNMNAPLMQNQY